MTFAELEQTWVNNGGNPAYAAIMAAIAMAESGGNPTNQTGDNGTSWGLWQIHWTVHPQFNVWQLLDPNYNANAAIQLSGNGENLTPWSTWSNRAYQQYLSGAEQAANSLGYGSQNTPAPSGGSSAPSSGGQPQNDWWHWVFPGSQTEPQWTPGYGSSFNPIDAIGQGIETTGLLLVAGFLVVGGLIALMLSNNDVRETVVDTAKGAALA